VMPFWRAVLGYEYCGSPAEDLIDPRGRGPGFWFQQMDAPRPQRSRVHIDVWVPYEQAEARIAAALAAGGRLVSDEHAQPAPFTRYIFPALLILGGLAALAGSSSLIGASPVPLSTRVRRIGQGTAAWGRTTRSRLGLRRSK